MSEDEINRLLQQSQEQSGDAPAQESNDANDDLIKMLENADDEDVQKFLDFVKALRKIAPVFFSPGNHELGYMASDELLLDRIEKSGAAVFNDSYADVILAGQPLRIGGTDRRMVVIIIIANLQIFRFHKEFAQAHHRQDNAHLWKVRALSGFIGFKGSVGRRLSVL